MVRDRSSGSNARLIWTIARSIFSAMQVSITDAKAQLTELVRRAEAGEEVVLTRHGHPTVRLAPIPPVADKERRWARIEEICKAAAAKATPGPCAARSQDFLFDENGMPG
jgi:prevent-host-death family protein